MSNSEELYAAFVTLVEFLHAREQENDKAVGAVPVPIGTSDSTLHAANAKTYDENMRIFAEIQMLHEATVKIISNQLSLVLEKKTILQHLTADLVGIASEHKEVTLALQDQLNIIDEVEKKQDSCHFADIN